MRRPVPFFSLRPTAPMPAVRILRALILAGPVLACLVLLGADAASARSLVLESFDSEIHVHDDGLVTVTETLRPRFKGSWKGIYRTIPVEYRTPQGLNYSLLLDVEWVRDGKGKELRYKTSRERHYRKLKIWVPDAQDATRTVVIRYRIPNALRFFEEYDELYWNVTGDEWEIPIERASATVGLPLEVTGVRATAFTGGYGSREQAAEIEVEGPRVSFETARALRMKEGLTIAVAWDPGVVDRPGPVEKAGFFLRSNLALLAPLLLGGIMFWIWRRRGRDPRRQPLPTVYEPPLGLSPAELGTLIDGKPDLHDITSTLVDLAVRGHIRIAEEERGFLGLGRKYTFRLLKSPDPYELRPHELVIVKAIFDGGTNPVVSTEDLENEFYKELPDIRDNLYDALVERGYWASRPDKVKGRWIGGAVAVSIAVGILILWISADNGLSLATAWVSIGLTAALLLAFAILMPRRTRRGARAQEKALGFEEFLSRVESDRYERIPLTPEMFEAYLPYAMALQVEDRWAKAFEGIYQTSPAWYAAHGVHHFHPTDLSHSLNSMASSAGSAMTSSPRSSGGTSFGGGGGGFGGGGFGGGGGGGF